MVLVICLVIVICGLFAYWINMHGHKRSEFYEKIKHIPCTNRTFPLLGDIHIMLLNSSINEKMKNIIKLIRNYPTTLKLWFGPKLIIIVNNSEDIKTILTSPYCTNKSSVYRLAIGGNGIFTVNGEAWKIQRRHLNTTFNAKVLNSYSGHFNRYGRNLVAALKEYVWPNDNKIDITPILGAHVTDLIARTLYGSSLPETFEVSKHCYKIIEQLMNLWGQRTLKFFFYFLLIVVRKIFRFQSNDKILNKQLRTCLQPIFDQKVNEYKDGTKSCSIAKLPREEEFLDKLTRLHFEGMIETNAYRHTSMTMFMAGTETTARSISLVILMFAIHERFQEAVYEEIRKFFNNYPDPDIDESKLNELPILDRFVKETYRLFPIVPFLGRNSTRDIPLTKGIIPAGTDIIISVVNLHQHPLIWGDEANKFNPDNFLPENVAQRERCSFIPFSYGPRNCIGYKFAQISSYIAIIHLLKSYKFTTSLTMEDVEVGYGLTTYILNENMVSVHSRGNTD